MEIKIVKKNIKKPMPDLPNKNDFNKVVENYQEAANYFKRRADVSFWLIVAVVVVGFLLLIFADKFCF